MQDMTLFPNQLADQMRHQLVEAALEVPLGGPSYAYRGARIDCQKGGTSAAWRWTGTRCPA